MKTAFSMKEDYAVDSKKGKFINIDKNKKET